ncbi:hypothetical protein E2C01_067328 [Portunus trituberculatus]|uniref:Uncharacterized protein n=1 Tax=Portunus trituberculatus TaxID=210409 RepID=A0A5B7HNU0_PORTR|nr:hypothetical protein [Portunus trituberculatus]
MLVCELSYATSVIWPLCLESLQDPSQPLYQPSSDSGSDDLFYSGLLRQEETGPLQAPYHYSSPQSLLIQRTIRKLPPTRQTSNVFLYPLYNSRLTCLTLSLLPALPRFK